MTTVKTTIADSLRKVADWLDEHPEEHPLTIDPDGDSVRVLLRGELDEFRRYFPGATATKTRDGNYLRYDVEHNGVTYRAMVALVPQPLCEVEEVVL